MKQLKSVLYFFWTGTQYNLLIFWLILISTMTISLGIAFFIGLGGTDITMIFAVSAVVYIYCGVLGFTTVKASIPYLLKLGVTRKKMFTGLGIGFVGMALFLSLSANVVYSMFKWVTDTFHIEGYQLMHIAQLIEDTYVNRFVIDFTVMLFIMAGLFLLGLLFYNYGVLGGGILLGSIAILFLTGLGTGWVQDMFINIYTHIDVQIFTSIFAGAAIIIYILGWSLVRQITIVKTG